MIPGAGRVWCDITQQFRSLSPWCFQTRIELSCCCRQNRDLAVNTMPFHYVIHVLRPTYQWRRKCVSFPVKCKQSNGRLADIPLCFRRLWMVRAVLE
ncbi:hypothetical protein TNCV_1189781 [Trichonephila clavipes]|nr:hypothetical protein TNCV_1189781 [Trichonephila clavipes]